ncbi:MAG: M48 family metallopeptidase [Clostridiales bacterium]|nr:M48 family metallopeptidase [Clostridiales bacterium]
MTKDAVTKLNYEIIRSERKSVSFEITREAELLIRAPKRMKLEEIEAYIANYRGWIEKNIAKARQRVETTKQYTEEELKEKAQAVIPHKVRYWASVMNLVPTGVRITKAKTRFGSCSAKDSLCFSLYLMQYPEEAIDYVVVHELAHIKVKNHGREFYALIERYLPDYRERMALLK